MRLTVYENLEQGTEEWLDARAGILTASTMRKLVTPTGKLSNSQTAKTFMAELAAERITGWSEPVFQTRDMERGVLDEPLARALYAEKTGVKIEQCGFMKRTLHGMPLGYSPDGLVGEEGLIEIKSRKQRYQVDTFLHGVPAEFMAQLQTGLYVSGREWIDFISFCGGMPLYVERVYPDPDWQAVIREALEAYEGYATQVLHAYTKATDGLPNTERPIWYLPEPQDIDLEF